MEVIDVAAQGLPDKGGAVDWLALHPDATTTELLALHVIRGRVLVSARRRGHRSSRSPAEGYPNW